MGGNECCECVTWVCGVCVGNECCVCVSWGCGMCGSVCVVCELGMWDVCVGE